MLTIQINETFAETGRNSYNIVRGFRPVFCISTKRVDKMNEYTVWIGFK